MSGRKEVQEVREVNDVKEKLVGIAAFFDLDGTLLPLPSLERRFFRMLRRRGEIPQKNYFLWLAEALRLLPRGIATMLNANKMYLRGVRVFEESGAENFDEFSAHEEALERVAWHAKQGHVIAIVSGTLEPLAIAFAQALEGELASRGVDVEVRVRATRLETVRGYWTGRVLGDAMFGTAKACAARRLAEELRIDLSQSFAYGDGVHDQWLLESVGNPFAVNPSRELLRIAKKRDWQVLGWNQEKLTERTSSQRSQSKRSETGKLAGESLLPEHSRTLGKQFRSVGSCT
ncbi:MAG TPA: HAD-IB family phosphatase [Candidatus Acidoferrum sp.]|nr:HAD-IB family phosphatase [Candidatus Acidoferrum sp.]